MYDDARLMEMRLNYLDSEKPEELAALKRAGTLEEHLQERVDACRKEAKRLVAVERVSEVQADQWAIRTKLLDSPRD